MCIRDSIRPLHVRELIDPDVWASSFKFSFVRNPFDRMVSLYHFHRQLHPERFPLAAEADFAGWVRGGGSGTAQRSMKSFISDDVGNRIVDFVGRFEQLHDDFGTICERIGVDAKLKKVNASKHKHYSEYYDDESQALVTEWVREDLDEFGYEF